MIDITRAAMLAGAALSAGALAAAPAEPPQRDLGRTVSEAIEAEGPVLTDAERTLIGAKCGDPEASSEGEDIRFEDGVLVCENGRRVDDPEVRAAMARMGQRIEARVSRAMASAEVAEALSRRTESRVAEAMAQVEAQRPEIERAVAGARATIARIDTAAIRAAAARARLSAAERARLRADVDRVRADMRRMREDIRRDVDRELRREGVH